MAEHRRQNPDTLTSSTGSVIRIRESSKSELQRSLDIHLVPFLTPICQAQKREATGSKSDYQLMAEPRSGLRYKVHVYGFIRKKHLTTKLDRYLKMHYIHVNTQ